MSRGTLHEPSVAQGTPGPRWAYGRLCHDAPHGNMENF